MNCVAVSGFHPESACSKAMAIGVSFNFLPKGGLNEIIGGGGGKYVSVCKACGKLGGCSPAWEIFDFGPFIRRNLVEPGMFSHKHNLSFIVSSFYNTFTCKIEFSAYPRGGKPKPRGACPPRKKPWPCMQEETDEHHRCTC